MKFQINIYISIIFLFFIGLGCLQAQENDDQKIIQFSGVVVASEDPTGVPGVHVYVPKAGRGTTTNQYGYFSMPVLIGDSVVISAVGFEKQNFIIPDTEEDAYTVVVEMIEDTTFLPEVEIFPYPTEELFKEAVLALKLPDQQQYEQMRENLNQEALNRMFNEIPMDGKMNHRYFQQQQLQQWNDRFGLRSNPLLNPFAWAEFINSLKKKKKKD